MSILNLLKTPISFIRKDLISIVSTRKFCSEVSEVTEASDQNNRVKRKGQRRPVSVNESIRYLESRAYRSTYGNKPIWHTYVRNFIGQFPPDTRRTCFRSGQISTASPCPICRDKYLLPDFRNVKLIKQFISPFGGEIYSSKKTGVCQVQYKKLLFAIRKAQFYGLITYPIPFREYDYSLYTK